MPAPEAIFRPVVPGEAVATLVLIETHKRWFRVWSDLRDHHLLPPWHHEIGKPIVPVSTELTTKYRHLISSKIQVLWLITSPVDDDESSPSHYDNESQTSF